MPDRDASYELMCRYTSSDSLRRHMLAVEAAMRAYAEKLGEDVETWRIVGYAREKKSVFLSILGISWFWFYGSAVTLQIPAYTLDILNGSEEITTFHKSTLFGNLLINQPLLSL